MNEPIVYTYQNCDSCRKAVRFLREKEISFKERPIRETPPNRQELQSVLAAFNGDIRKLFNTSGREYRSLNMKDKVPGLSTEEALFILENNGHLVKRPLLVTAEGGWAGFQEEEWEKILPSQ